MKNQARIDGEREARRHLREIVVVTTEEWWTKRMEAYANGHFSTKQARDHFCEGWKSVPPPPFVQTREVTLIVLLMNVFPEKEGEYSPLEQDMYETFHTHSSMSRITYLSISKVCIKYEIKSTVDGLNMAPIVRFLKQRLVSYKLAPKDSQDGTSPSPTK